VASTDKPTSDEYRALVTALALLSRIAGTTEMIARNGNAGHFDENWIGRIGERMHSVESAQADVKAAFEKFAALS
jgi:hypothetical protein